MYGQHKLSSYWHSNLDGAQVSANSLHVWLLMVQHLGVQLGCSSLQKNEMLKYRHAKSKFAFNKSLFTP